jgi:hypothetical protein
MITNFVYSDLADQFTIQFMPVTRPLNSWPNEIAHTAREIAASTDRPLILCYSGGIDSEVIAKTFVADNIKFTALSMRHSSGTNDHDICWAVEFCKKHNVEHKIIDFDIEDFFNVKMQDYIDRGYRTWRPWRLFQLFLLETVESLGGCAVMGAGIQSFDTVAGEICIKYPPEHAMCLDWCKNNNSVHFPYFYQHNPEVFAAYMKIDLIETMLSNPNYFVNVPYNMSLEKIIVYRSLWQDMPRRSKFDGFENVQPLRTAAIKRYKQQLPNLGEIAIPVKTIKQQLGI